MQPTFSISPHNAQLRSLVESPSVDGRIRSRARILLLSERLASPHDVARAAGTSVITVRKWQTRFAAAGVDALLCDAPRPGRPSKVDDGTREQILTLGRATSTRGVARKVGLSRSTVHRVLRQSQTPEN